MRLGKSVCAWMYIRVYAYEYAIQLCRPTFKCDCEFVYACIKACIHMLVIYVCMPLDLQVNASVNLCILASRYVYTCWCMYVSMRACMMKTCLNACMHACMRVRLKMVKV